MIKILIVDDHKIVRESLKLILAETEIVDVVAEAANGIHAMDVLLSIEGRVDIVLTDNQMPVMNGVTLAQGISEKYPAVKVIMLSMVDDEREVARAFASGIRGYLLKSVQAPELVFCIQHVYQGNQYLASALTTRYLSLFPDKQETLPAFAERELAILKLIARGLTNAEIANQLLLGQRTVEGIRQELLSKTNTRNSASLIYYAVTSRLL